MSKVQFLNSIFLAVSSLVAVILLSSPVLAATQDVDRFLIDSTFSEDKEVTSRPNGFRLIGDRSNTLWLTPGTPISQTENFSEDQDIAFNQYAVIETVKFLTSKPVEAPSVTGENANISFVTRKVDSVQSGRNGAVIPWPILFASACFALLLWAGQKRRTTEARMD